MAAGQSRPGQRWEFVWQLCLRWLARWRQCVPHRYARSAIELYERCLSTRAFLADQLRRFHPAILGGFEFLQLAGLHELNSRFWRTIFRDQLHLHRRTILSVEEIEGRIFVGDVRWVGGWYWQIADSGAQMDQPKC